MPMMIVQGTFRLASSADRDAFLVSSIENMKIAREEKGCREYVMAADPIEADRVVLSEFWESMEDLEEHIRAIGRRRREAADSGRAPALPEVVERQVWRYEVASEQTMG
jgi:quinol monooxygenase YgiN